MVGNDPGTCQLITGELMNQSSINRRPAKGWNIFFGILFTITLFLSMLSIILNRTLFSEKYFQETLAEQKVYDQIPTVLAETVQINSGKGDLTTLLFGKLTKEQLIEFFNLVLPENYVRTQSDSLLDSVFSFVNLQTKTFSLSIDTTPVKENLQGEASAEATNLILASIPDCSMDQVNLFGQWLLQSSQPDLSTLPICKPPEPLLSLLTPYLTSTIQQSSSVIPSQITFGGEAADTLSQNITQSKYYATYELIRNLLVYVPWAALVLGLLLIMLNLSSVKRLLKTLGIPILISGSCLILLFGGVDYSLGKWITSKAVISQIESLNVIFSSTFQAIRSNIFMTALTFGGIALGLGLILVVISAKLQTRKQ
jgi:hypothetical protein